MRISIAKAFCCLVLILLFNSPSIIAQFSHLDALQFNLNIVELEQKQKQVLENNFVVYHFIERNYQNQAKTNELVRKDTVPKPRYVLMRSLFVPGWGQIINEQSWKVPIVYAALIGVGYYSYWLHGQYTDFRAAYYNSFATTNPDYADKKFGETPARLANASVDALKYYRNYYRNERDFMLLMFVLTYGLNAIDAYIFAQLKDFDVSDDLSLQASPIIDYTGSAGAQLSLSITF